MRILLWHGYLLGGTGSNVYTRALAREWSLAGHDVTVVCQERHPELYDLGGAKVVRPDVGPILPVFVLDRYEGVEARRLHELERAAADRFVAASAAALRELLPADLIFTNHVLLGGPVGAAAVAGTTTPFAVKAHGSELEYSMRDHPDLAAWGRESLRDASGVFVGSAHIRAVLAEVCGTLAHPERVHEVPPGVDVDEFQPVPRAVALSALVREARADDPNPGNAEERLADEGNATRLAAFLADASRPTVLYFGKLIRNKGVHLLLEALQGLDARAVIVGFGDYREELEAQARALGSDVLFTGPLEHRHLRHLVPLCDVSVVPSIFPEAFGMVAAEAAAGGACPLVARHSGLAEVAAGVEEEYPAHLRHLAAFETGSATDLRAKLAELLALAPAERQELQAAARRAVIARWSWAGIARRLLDLSVAAPSA